MMNRKSQQIDDAFQSAFDPATDSFEWLFEFKKRINEALESTARGTVYRPNNDVISHLNVSFPPNLTTKISFMA